MVTELLTGTIDGIFTVQSPQEGTRMLPSHTNFPDEMPHPDTNGCRTTREILDRIGDKWSLYIIATLSHGVKRFNELKRGIDGISQRMLTLTLRGLERDGLITRTMYPTIPPRVDYELTELGQTLLVPVMALVSWADNNQLAIAEAHRRFDEESEPERIAIQSTIYQQR